MTSTMPQDGFYAKVCRGMPALIRQWLILGRGDADRLALILAETARVAGLGDPGETPSGEQLQHWAEGGELPPHWAVRTALFLLVQMPARPTPESDNEACTWAYCWLRNRDFTNRDAALSALPDHLRSQLSHAVTAAWADRQGLRLV